MCVCYPLWLCSWCFICIKKIVIGFISMIISFSKYLQTFNDANTYITQQIKVNVYHLVTASKRSLGQGNAFYKGLSFSDGVGVSVWCHFLSGCLVPCSFKGRSLSLVPCSFWSLCWGSLSRGALCKDVRRPPKSEKRTIRILLSCFVFWLVSFPYPRSRVFRGFVIWQDWQFCIIYLLFKKLQTIHSFIIKPLYCH